MSSEIERTSSRRALLGAALGALTASLANAIGRPIPTDAADGDVVHVGDFALVGSLPIGYTCTSDNALRGSAEAGGAIGVFGEGLDDNDQIGVKGQALNTRGTGVYGVGAKAGVWGASTAVGGIAVLAEATGSSTTGVYASAGATDGVAIFGTTSGIGSTRAVYGRNTSTSGTAVYAESVATSGTTRGVYGTAMSDTGFGVDGSNPGGVAVRGSTASGTGVRGTASSAGAGVYGSSSSGIGVRASSSTGNALQVSGRAVFNRSGRASVAINATYVDVTVPGGLSSTANVLATLQAYRSGVYVAAVRTNYPTTGKARIYLNKVASTTVTTPVAWFVLN